MEWAILHSFHKHSPDGAARARWHTSGSAYYSSIDLERMKGWVGLVGWPYSGWFTHISGHPSATGRAWDRESLRVKDQRSTTVQRSQLMQVCIFKCDFSYSCAVVYKISTDSLSLVSAIPDSDIVSLVTRSASSLVLLIPKCSFLEWWRKKTERELCYPCSSGKWPLWWRRQCRCWILVMSGVTPVLCAGFLQICVVSCIVCGVNSGVGPENGAIPEQGNSFQRPNNFGRHASDLMPFGFKPDFMHHWNLPQRYNPYAASCSRVPGRIHTFERLPTYGEESTGSHEVISKEESSNSPTDRLVL